MTGYFRMSRHKLLFFAGLGEQLGCRAHEVDCATDIDTVAALIDSLCSQHDKWQALRDMTIKVAVNQTVVHRNHPLTDGDEIAFFPPVTGG